MAYTVKEQIELAQAWENGEELEWKPIDGGEWNQLGSKEWFYVNCGAEHQFDFNTNFYRIKSKWWRANKGGGYYFLFRLTEVCSATEDYCEIDDYRYQTGNYFRTVEQAKQAMSVLGECLIKLHESL